MDTNKLIELLGGRKKVIADTGLSKGRISQWATDNKITESWLQFLKQKYKRIPWSEYEPADSPVAHK